MTDDQRPRAASPHGDPVPLIASGPIYLRAGERSDIPLFQRWMNDARTTRTILSVNPVSEVMEERWFEQMVEGHGRDRWFFVICRIEDNRPVGTIDLRGVDLRNGSASLGIVIGDPADTRQGYGSGAIRALIRFGFDQLRLERVQLEVFDFNDDARRLYDRIGFVHEGTRRRALFRDGAYHDVHGMAILRDEWAALPRED